MVFNVPLIEDVALRVLDDEDDAKRMRRRGFGIAIP